MSELELSMGIPAPSLITSITVRPREPARFTVPATGLVLCDDGNPVTTPVWETRTPRFRD